MRCAKCGSESPAGKNFCGDCGAELSNRCPSCGAIISDSWKFCRDCGAAVSIATAPANLGAPLTAGPDSGSDLEGERLTVATPLVNPFAANNGSTNVTDLGPLPSRQGSAGHQVSKFVGREGELVLMNQALELAGRGHGQIV